MKADEAADLIDREGTTDRFKQRAAIVIAVFAMLLAITGLGSGLISSGPQASRGEEDG